MSVFSGIRGFFSRHKNKFIVGGIIITGSVILTKYAQRRLREWQEKETREFLERNRKQNHFESIGRTCNQTISNLSGALYEVILNVANTDDIIETLKTNPENKLLLWNDLKVWIKFHFIYQLKHFLTGVGVYKIWYYNLFNGNVGCYIEDTNVYNWRVYI